MVNVHVQHFDLYQLPESKLTNANILCLVRFGSEQISAVTDSVPDSGGRTVRSLCDGADLCWPTRF